MKLLYRLQAQRNSLFSLFILIAITVGCKKPEADTQDTSIDTDVPTTGTREQLTKDSIYLYAKQVYFWNDAVPGYAMFKPRNYNSFESELFAITQLKINPSTGLAYEYPVPDDPNSPKFSYITDADLNGSLASANPFAVSQVDLEGNGSDFGIALTAIGTQSAYQIYIRYVSPGSSAAKNLVNRGDRLEKVGDHTLGKGYTADNNAINVAFDKPTITLSGKKENGSSFTVTLKKENYSSNPVYKDTVITSTGNKKIGYLAFARFSDEDNAIAPLNTSFAKFAAEGVTNLVIDLRYNGGGYVSTAEHLANLIVPTAINGSTMFTEYFNTTMQSGKATILKNQPLLTSLGKSQYQNGKLVTYFDQDYSAKENTYKFDKQGSLTSVTKVVFLVSNNTASASELVINVLKPYLDVKIIGSATYGKPVGFFPVKIDKYDVYLTMFETKNSNGEGNYYAGFTPNIGVADDVTHDFGDPNEAQFAAAINYLSNGTLSAKSPVATIMGTKMSIKASDVKNLGNEKDFKGMIENRGRTRK